MIYNKYSVDNFDGITGDSISTSDRDKAIKEFISQCEETIKTNNSKKIEFIDLLYYDDEGDKVFEIEFSPQQNNIDEVMFIINSIF